MISQTHGPHCNISVVSESSRGIRDAIEEFLP
jgi:hypothetical protein